MEKEDEDNKDLIAYGLDRYSYQQGENAKYGFTVLKDVEPALVARGGAAVCCPRYMDSISRQGR